jgi:hypothetical protein
MEDRPWEGDGPLRFDFEPHRGRLLLTLAVLGLWMGVATLFVGGACGPLGLPLSITTWLLARRDLRRIRAGSVDPTGEQELADAREGAFGGIMLNGLGFGFWSVLALLVFRAQGN